MQSLESPFSFTSKSWFKDGSDACSESSSPSSSPLMVPGNCMAEKASPTIDLCSHITVCLQFFQAMTVPESALGSGKVPPIPTAVGHIYSDAITMLQQLTLSRALGSSLDSISDNLDTYQHDSAVEVVKDLILVSSFICTSAIGTSSTRKVQNAGGSSKASRSTSLSPAGAMVSLGPFWAMALLLSGNGQLLHSNHAITANGGEDAMKLGRILDSFVMLVTNPLTVRGTKDITDEALCRLNQLQTSMQKTMHATGFIKLFNRLKKFLKSAMVSPLHFMTIFGLSMHSDLTNAALNACKTQLPDRQLIVDHTLSLERDLVELVITMVKIAPNQVMMPDRSNSEATPLSYVAAYRGIELSLVSSIYASAECLPLALCRGMTLFCPSSMAIADKFGLFPLHLAARRGHSSTMSFLCKHFPHSCALRDSTGKLALHHALLSHHHHNEESILALAAVHPAALVDDSNGICNNISSPRLGFNVMLYVQKNCAVTLYTSLHQILTQYRESLSGCQQITSCSNDSYTTEATHSSCSEISSSDGERESLSHEDNFGVEMLTVMGQSLDSNVNVVICNDKKAMRKRKNQSTNGEKNATKKASKSVVSEADASILLQFADTLKMLYSNHGGASVDQK